MNKVDIFLSNVFLDESVDSNIDWWTVLNNKEIYKKVTNIIEDDTCNSAILYARDSEISIRNICKLKLRYHNK